MITKTSSILDYSYPFLDPAVWDQDMKLYAYQKDFILRLLDKMYETYSLKEHKKWVEDVVILGSLTTTKWLLSSDLDVHVRVNLNEFIKTNMPNSSKEEAFAKLDETRKEFDRAKILAPMTQHPTEFYIESLELHPSNTQAVGVYSLYQDKWLKEPIALPAELDIEESKRKVVEEAEALAQELDGSLGKIRRDIQRIDELDAVIQAWGKDKQKLFYTKIEKKLNDIEEEIKKDIKIKQDLVDYRHSNQDPTSENEILFKYLARNGFFAILQNLKELLESTDGEVTVDELPLIEKVISQASINKISSTDYWVDPNGKFYNAGLSHGLWIWNNKFLLSNDYGFKIKSQSWQNFSSHDLLNLIRSGWVRIAKDRNIELKDIFNVPEFVFDYLSHIPEEKVSIADLDNLWIQDLSTELAQGQKAINRALSHKRLQTASMQKFASFMKKSGSVLDVNGVRVYKDPTFEQVENLFEKSQENFPQKSNKHLRYILSPETNELFVWDAFAQHHVPIAEGLGINIDDEIYDNYTGDILSEYDIESVFEQQTNMKLHPVASMKKANEDIHQELNNKILVDFDGTIAHDMPDHSIGKPINGVKEALQKLKELGYELEIFSSRANDEKGLDEVKNYLDSHEIPYDSIFQGEKPLAKYFIDNSSIHFDNWNNVLKQVEKSEKKASLRITSASRYWVDPSGKVYPVKDTHADWIMDNEELVRLEVFEKHPEELYPEEKDNTDPIMNIMLRDGWLRVGDLFNVSGEGKNYGKHFIGQGIEIADINNAPQSLFDFTSNYGKDKYFIIEDLRKRYVEVSVEELMADGQEAINRALQRGKMVHASINLPMIDPKTFKRKEPYALFIGTSDYGKIGKFDMFNVYGEHPMITPSNQLPTVGLDTLIKENIPIIGKEPRAGDKQPVQDISGLVKQAQTKKVKQGDYSCLMALVPHDLAQEIVEYGVRTVPDDKLYLDEEGNLGRELESHITIKYGLLTNEAKDLRRSFNDEKPFKATLGKVKHFQPPELPFDVLTIEVISDDLIKANQKVCENFECAEGLVSDEYHPHITIAYMKRDTAKEYVGSDEFEGKELELDTLVFSPHKGNRTYFSISNDKESRFVLEKIDKTASVEEVEGVNVLVNPTFNEVLALWKRSSSKHLRLLSDSSTGDKYIWDAYFATHDDIQKKLTGFRDTFQKDDLDNLSVIRSLFKTASGNNFYPSLVQAPNNPWQSDSDLEIPVEPDSQSDESTVHMPCTTGKPRSVDVWKQILYMIKSPFSKKEVESASDTEQEAIEQNELGENETLLEYSKGFKDLNRLNTNKPKTTWSDNSSSQGGEPYAPLPSFHVETNPDNENWRYPWKFTSRPRGEDSDDGKTIEMLREQEKRKACIEKMTREITSSPHGYGGWVSPKGEITLADDHGWAILRDPKKFGFEKPIDKDHVRWQYIYEALYNEGWLQFRIWGSDLHFSGSNLESLKKAENLIFNELNSVKEISFNANDGNYVATVEEFRDKGFEAFSKHVMAKQAGTYSASVPDYQGEQYYNEQHMNDTDCEPYVNHDQRDYPYGMHDSPENTDSGIGWAKDNSPQTVFLDVMEKAFDRRLPSGIPWYSVEYANALPMSSDFEATNTD